VFDLDSIQLLAMARAMAHGRYMSGRTIEPAPRLFLGAVENPGAPPFEYRVARAMKKVRAGARFFQLQLCFETAMLERFMTTAVAQGLAAEAALLPSICLVRAPAALRYIDEHVPGISVPHEAIERIERAPDQEEACFQYGLELAAHALVQPGVAGLHLISFRREAGIARLCRELGIPTRVERESSGYRTPVAV
jgi:methylenetetrahydrofolate reductase (NADPH)